MCGLFGIVGSEDAARIVYLGLHSLQHRGQEGSGITTAFEGGHNTIKKLGLVGDIFDEAALKKLKGHSAIGHNRYSTTGDNNVRNLQPFSVRSGIGWLAVAHNGNLTNADSIIKKLEASGSIFQSTTDTEVLIHLIAKSGKHLPEALQEALSQVEGAYSLLVLNQEVLIAVRDPNGLRPLVLGKYKGCPVLSSESTSFDLIGASYIREIMPGELLTISLKDMSMRSLKLGNKTERKRCVFEHIYFSRPDSYVFGASVHEVRKAFGRRLAQEQPVDADVVIPVPDSGIPSSLGYAEESGIPFDLGIIRSHYAMRSFIQPKQSLRDLEVKLKLNSVGSCVHNRRVIIVDDSLVRGTTSKKIIKMLRDSGAVEVHLRISAPPTTYPCYYGIATPDRSKLVAANYDIEELCNIIGADSIGYLSLEGMLEVAEKYSGSGFCDACFSGNYVTDVPCTEVETKRTALTLV